MRRADTIANYHSLQAEFRKALSAGLTFQTAYTYSKALSENDSFANRVIDNIGTSYVSLDPLNPSRDYGRSGTDQRHTLVINGQYALPFAERLKGRMPKAILGGWTASGIWQYGSGLPLNANTGFNNSGNGDTTPPDRPNLTPGFSNNPTSGVTAGCGGIIPAGQALRTPTRWFDPCAFSLPVAGTYGNLGRDTMNGPVTNMVNFTLAKNSSLTETVKLQFRAEFFNLFNHANFGTPSIAIFQSDRTYSGSAGVVANSNNPGLGGRNIQFGLKLVF